MSLATMFRRRAVVVLATCCVVGVVGPSGANASGPTAFECDGNSTSPPVFTESDILCGGWPPTDDDGPYKFTYVPPLTCAVPTGAFIVVPLGSELGAPGVGTYTSDGTTIEGNFQYVVVESAAPPDPPVTELHHFRIQIACANGHTHAWFNE